MQFYSVRDFRTSPKNVWDSLRTGDVVLTNNGKPAALMLDLSKGDFEETMKAVRHARALMTFKRMRERAAAAGYMTDEEINAEIAAARKEMRDAGRA